MEILGLRLVPDYTKGLDYTVFKGNKVVGFITFVWGYVRVSKCVSSENRLGYQEIPLAHYYYWEENVLEDQYPPGSIGIKLIKKCVRRLKVSLFFDKILFRN